MAASCCSKITKNVLADSKSSAFLKINIRGRGAVFSYQKGIPRRFFVGASKYATCSGCKVTYNPGCKGSAAERPYPHLIASLIKRGLPLRPQKMERTFMALSSPMTPGFLAAVPRSSGRWRASIETPQQSSSVGKSLRFPPRLGPLFWPWEKVKVGPLSVSPMGFGTWAWGNQLLWGYQEQMDGVLQETFNLALRNGITLFDTADSYGTGRLNGKSEKLLGKFIREFQGSRNIQDNIVIATKFAAYPWRLTSGQFVRACKSSLDRLQLDQIGIGQLHWSTANYAPLQELALWDGLAAIYEKGLVRAVGVSNYGPKQLIKIHNYLTSRGVPLCSAQVQFSLLSMGNDQLELKAVCDSLGVRLIAYSPLGLGMLTGKYTASNLPQGPRGFLFRQILPGLDPLLSSLKEIAQKRRKTMSQVAINWCICKGTIPIPGVKTVKQAEENLGSLGWRLNTDEIFELESAAKNSPKKMIQNIFQTI